MLENMVMVGFLPVSIHDTLVGLGMLVGGIVMLTEARRRGLMSHPHWWWIVIASLMGAAIGARLVPMLLEIDWSRPESFQEAYFGANRSILGALAGSYAAVLIAKRITGFQWSTGDAFAPGVAIGMAIGRFGCLLTELPGTPTGTDWGLVLTTEQAARIPGGQVGVPLHPSFVYEIVFHAVAFAWLWSRRHADLPPDWLFRRYVWAYAAFRFLVEFVRGNDEVWFGLSRPQWFLLAATLVGVLWSLARARMRGAVVRDSQPVRSSTVGS